MKHPELSRKTAFVMTISWRRFLSRTISQLALPSEKISLHAVLICLAHHGAKGLPPAAHQPWARISRKKPEAIPASGFFDDL